MQELRVRLPLALFRVPSESVRPHTSRDVSQRHDLLRARKQDVGKPGILPGTGAAWSREHEIAGSNPAVLTWIAVGPVLVRVGGC